MVGGRFRYKNRVNNERKIWNNLQQQQGHNKPIHWTGLTIIYACFFVFVVAAHCWNTSATSKVNKISKQQQQQHQSKSVIYILFIEFLEIIIKCTKAEKRRKKLYLKCLFWSDHRRHSSIFISIWDAMYGKRQRKRKKNLSTGVYIIHACW